MLDPKTRKKLKELVGKHYTSFILERLQQKGITNKNGKPYTATYIRMVFNGFRNNYDIENTIMELLLEKINERKKIIRKIKKIDDEMKDI